MILLLSHVRPDGEADTYHLKPGRRYHLGRGSTCEIRLLDLKLSRRHCAVEYQGGEWRVLDLGSTNGCRVGGDLIHGAVVLHQRDQIEIGGSVLQVYRILGDDEDAPEDVSGLRTALDIPSGEGVQISGLRPAALVSEPAVPRGVHDSGEVAAGELRDPDAVPEPASEPKRRTEVLSPIPVAASPAKVRTPLPALSGQEATLVVPAQVAETIGALPNTQGPTTAPLEPAKRSGPVPTPDLERVFFINVLGVRVGPLTRAQARDLKARELKGELTASDLDSLPKG